VLISVRVCLGKVSHLRLADFNLCNVQNGQYLGYKTVQRLRGMARESTKLMAGNVARVTFLYVSIAGGGVVFCGANLFMVYVQDEVTAWWLIFYGGHHAAVVAMNFWFALGAPRRPRWAKSHSSASTSHRGGGTSLKVATGNATEEADSSSTETESVDEEASS
jgi:hypothetical protein